MSWNRTHHRVSAWALVGVLVAVLGASGCGPTGDPDLPAGDSSRSVAPRIFFEPARFEFLDMGVGEERSLVLRLKVDGETETSGWELVPSCDCLAAEFVGDPGPRGVDVRIEVSSHQEEDIEGVLTLEDAARRRLAEFVAPIRITLKPWVSPREVILRPGETEFPVVLGQAVEPDAETPSLLHDLPIDDRFPFDLESHSQFEGKYLVLTEEFRFWVAEDLRGGFVETLQFRFGDPPRTFEVAVRRLEPEPPGR